MTKILIVDKNDKIVGAEERKIAQAKGLIHRIVRVFIFNSKGQFFLQKRGPTMDTFPNRWDQSVGGHVDKGEDYYDAAVRETKEELGIENIELKEVVKFYYKERFNGKILNRFNMLYEGVYDGKINLNSSEVSEGKWFFLEELDTLMHSNPNDFTPSFIETYRRYKKIKITN